jgi:ABC-type phosphate/phosphonate transport system permease subunit
MNFYDLSFLKTQAGLTDYLWYVFIFGSLILLIVVFSLYLKHRIKTKYRDLSLIFFLFLILSLGIQYSNYQVNQSRHSQSSQMVNFVEQFADNMKVEQKDILVSSTQLTDGIIVKVKDDFYTVNLNADQQSYTITETHLLNNKINIISK